MANKIMLLDLQGREFDWFAIDSQGNLAMFSTAGEGFIPKAVSEYVALYEAVSDLLEAPNTGTAQVWNDYSAQGLYVFDWSILGGPYVRSALPSMPPAEELRSRIVAITELPIFSGSFANLRQLGQWPAT